MNKYEATNWPYPSQEGLRVGRPEEDLERTRRLIHAVVEHLILGGQPLRPAGCFHPRTAQMVSSLVGEVVESWDASLCHAVAFRHCRRQCFQGALQTLWEGPMNQSVATTKPIELLLFK